MGVCDFVGGLIAGISGLLVGHPIDTVKVNQQVYTSGLKQTIQTIFLNHGLKGFYSGMAVPLLSSGAMQSIYFGVYGTTMDALIQHRKRKQEKMDLISHTSHQDENYEELLEKAKHRAAYNRIKPKLKFDGDLKATYSDCFIAGTTAGFFRLISSCPVEVIKTRLQSQKDKIIYKGPYDCVKHILATQGVRGLFVGGVPLCGRAYGLGLYAVFYEYLKVNTPISNIGVRLFVAGGTAGLLQWWAVIPLDVLKARMQADDPENPKYKGVIDCVKKMYLTEGWKSFFRGIVPLSIRAFPVNGATFLAYETVFRLCKKYETSFGGTPKNDHNDDIFVIDVDKYCHCSAQSMWW